jgi:hypothetical protein
VETNQSAPDDDSPRTVIDDRMFEEFRELRKAVWFKATKENPHNQRRLRKMVDDLSDKADLKHWRTNSPATRSELWKQIVESLLLWFCSGEGQRNLRNTPKHVRRSHTAA